LPIAVVFVNQVGVEVAGILLCVFIILAAVDNFSGRIASIFLYIVERSLETDGFSWDDRLGGRIRNLLFEVEVSAEATRHILEADDAASGGEVKRIREGWL
jgi:hypothetical protein